MNPRVLFLNHSASMGGAEFILVDIASSMKDSALVVLFEDGPLRQRLADAGVPVMVIDAGAMHSVRRGSAIPSMAAITSVWKTAAKVAKLAKSFDVLHANSQKALVVGSIAAKRANKPLLWHLHDIVEPPWFSRMNVAVDVFLANHFVKNVITVSQATADSFIQNGGRPDIVHVVYNGIDVSKFDITDAEALAARTALGLANVPVIGCFSRLAEWKGQHVLVEALARIPDAHALIVGGALFGEHPYERHLHELVHVRGLEGRVHFLGNRDDVPLLMRSVDLVVHPSTGPEPFARTLIESMLAHKAPIASACGGVPELIQHAQTGFLFNPGDAEGLARLLTRLLADQKLLHRIEDAAHDHAVRDFALPKFLRSITEHVRGVAGYAAVPTGFAIPQEASV